MSPPQTSVTEYAVLGLLAEGPSHGFALARALDGDSEVGRVFTVRRPLVYRALARLVDQGLAVQSSTEKGEGPQRVVHRITGDGLSHLGRWLDQPVAHVRDLRIEFLLKVSLLHRSGESPMQLIHKQRQALQSTLARLDPPGTPPDDHVELWRHHIAVAATTYLDDLEQMHLE